MFRFSSVQEGQYLISRKDSFLERLTPAEYSLRMGINFHISEEMFIEHLRNCILAWDDDEILNIGQVLVKAENIIRNLKMTIQEEVVLVKTSGKDEWNSAYTRCNAIFLPIKKIKSYTRERLLKFLLHEYFHIFFRFRKDLQEQFYNTIGFEIMPELQLPKALSNRVLTNPDAPFINRYIKVEYQGEQINAIPIALLKEDLINVNELGDILKSITAKFLYIQDESDSKALIIDTSDIKGFYEKVGNNTPSAVDPDEILAENFALFALNERNVPSVDVLDKIEGVIHSFI